MRPSSVTLQWINDPSVNVRRKRKEEIGEGKKVTFSLELVHAATNCKHSEMYCQLDTFVTFCGWMMEIIDHLPFVFMKENFFCFTSQLEMSTFKNNNKNEEREITSITFDSWVKLAAIALNIFCREMIEVRLFILWSGLHQQGCGCDTYQFITKVVAVQLIFYM